MSLLSEPLPRAEQQAFNLQRWEEILADASLAELPHRIETDGLGEIIMSPPTASFHARRCHAIVRTLDQLLRDGEAFTECPINTVDGVRAADVVWISAGRLDVVKEQAVYTIAPEICVEVISPSEYPRQRRHKRGLYFDAGAVEVWECGEDGAMRFYLAEAPDEPRERSALCPAFPAEIGLP